MPDQFSYDVFLSHNAKDKPRVRRLAERLKQAELRVWFDEWIIKPGDDIYLAIERGLEAARVQVLCLSEAALASDWVMLERSTVLFRDPTNAGRRFIPLLLANCDLPDTLRRYKYVDYREEAEAAFEELLTACRVDAAQAKPVRESPPTRVELKKKKVAKLPKRPEPLIVLERRFTVHRGWVKSIAVSRDGKWFVCGSHDGTIKICNLETGECRSTLEGHTDAVKAVGITSDGKYVVSGAGDHTLRVWDAISGEHLRTKDFGDGLVLCLAVSNDGSRVASGHARSTENIEVLNLKDLSRIWHVRETGSADTGVTKSIAINREQIATAMWGGEIMLWHIATGECLATLRGHSDIPNSIKITSDGRFCVSGSKDKTVKVWDLETQTCVGTLEGHQSEVTSVTISPSNTLIASAGFTDHTVRIWDLESGTCLHVIENNDTPTTVEFSPDGLRLVVGTARGAVYIYQFTGVRSAPTADAPRRYVNAKVVLLGEGTVGKTSLAYRLVDDKYVIKDRTHGMNVWKLDLPLAPDATMEREALLWDLAGQEDYRLIHKLFLDETALALLLVNPQRDDPFAEAGDWLKALDSTTNPDSKRNAERLLIFSQTDVGGMKLGNAKIDRFRKEHGFANWLSTSAKTGENCSDGENAGKPSKLKQLITESIQWNKLPWTSTPRLLAELKDAMMAMRDKTDIRLVRFAELSQRMEQALPAEKFGESEVRTAVTLLANNGLARPLKFGDLVLLQPELLNGYAGAIIRAARAHTDEIGCVLEADIYKPDFDFTGVERLKSRPDEELLLRALVQGSVLI